MSTPLPYSNDTLVIPVDNRLLSRRVMSECALILTKSAMVKSIMNRCRFRIATKSGEEIYIASHRAFKPFYIGYECKFPEILVRLGVIVKTGFRTYVDCTG